VRTWRGREQWEEEELTSLVTTGQQLQAQWTLEVHAGMQNVIMQHGSIFTLEVNAGMQNVIMQHGSIFTLEVNAGMQNVIMQHGSIFTFSLFQFENIHLCELQIFTQFIKIPMKCEYSFHVLSLISFHQI
jgi:hypothetical protein